MSLIFAPSGSQTYPSEVIAYFSADQGVTLNGSNVSQWNDLTGNGYDLAQATASKQPTYTTVSGLPTVRFDGTNDILKSGTLTLPQPYQVIMVMRLQAYNAGSGAYACVLSLREDSGVTILQYPSSGNIGMYAGALGPYADIGVAPATNKLLKMEFNGTASYMLRNNDAYAGGNPGTNAISVISLGGYHDESVGNFTQMDVYALAICDANLDFKGSLVTDWSVS